MIPLYTSTSSTILVFSDSSTSTASKTSQTVLNESSVSCHTDNHPDIPFPISLPLPPIFSSNLCFLTPQIKSMSRSLPNLNSILWFKTSIEEIVRDEAEELLANMYDKEVEEYYLMEREKIRKKK